jgi:bifunctional non-homologous end joining protein LigD
VARVRNGFVPATRRQVYKSINDKRVSKCPFVNLPDKEAGQWGQGLTAEKMKDCVWLTPTNVVRLDFLEWTAGDRLRHPKFVALRDDKDPLKVIKEGMIRRLV